MQRCSPMRHSHKAVGCQKASLHDVHVLPSDGVIQPEGLGVVGGHLKIAQLCHGAPPLMCYIVHDQQAARVRQLVVVAVVCLHQAGAARRLSRSQPLLIHDSVGEGLLCQWRAVRHGAEESNTSSTRMGCFI